MFDSKDVTKMFNVSKNYRYKYINFDSEKTNNLIQKVRSRVPLSSLLMELFLFEKFIKNRGNNQK